LRSPLDDRRWSVVCDGESNRARRDLIVTSNRTFSRHVAAMAAAAALLTGLTLAPARADAAAGFGPLSGPGGCLVAPEAASSESGTSSCSVGKALIGARAVAVSPDGANVYVAGGTAGTSVATSFGAVVILKRDPTTGAITETGCLSSDGTDGRDGASGACTPTPSLLGADGVAVSPDGSTVFVSSSSSASVVVFSRDPTTGSLTRLGCLQGTPRPGGPCGAANLFSSSSALAASTDGSALYVAAPLEGAISTLTAPPTTPVSEPGSSTSATANATASMTLASIFKTPPASGYLSNPCIAVNGLDGVCTVGTATQGLDDLVLSPDGKQLYAAAPGSKAIDVFATGAGGALSETGCLKVQAPPGLCSSAGKLMMSAPNQLAVSPDGQNVYGSDSLGEGGSVDVFDRNPATGSLSSSSCVDFLPKPEPKEPGEEGEEGEEEKSSAPPDPCASAPGLNDVSVVAVSGDGSSVYAIGSGSAAIFSRDAKTGKLTETSCAADEDSRCTSLPSLQGVSGAAVSPDGHEVYVVAAKSNAVMVFGIGASVSTASASASRAGTTTVRVVCPAGLRHTCSGRVELTRTMASTAKRRGRRLRVHRLEVGRSGPFSIQPGHQANVSLRLAPTARRLLLHRRHLRLMAVVRAAPSAGGSGFGRHVLFRLGRL
jgi:DNA-binding beta-propeller fold protein YncE